MGSDGWSIMEIQLDFGWTNGFQALGPLLGLASRRIDDEELGMVVKDYLDMHGNWDWDMIRDVLPHEVCLRINSILPACNENGQDNIAWGSSSNGLFSTRLAYNMLRDENGGDSPSCITGLLKDGSLLKQIRAGLMDDRFFHLPLRDWLFSNLATNHSQVFGTTLWLLWKWRNQACFETDFQRPLRPWLIIRNYLKEYSLATDTLSTCLVNHRKEEVLIQWKPPGEGWVRM
ncbi:Ribonuclease H protein [Quillaja saponaria]|uniref:Ribonuclease H protein n=1 Tax=Quillaja saponaria TaxID=32244 RepID=A0AAD7VKL5_QUISA|nr:Ribonuclease H protein [Quillaja saponaria]